MRKGWGIIRIALVLGGAGVSGVGTYVFLVAAARSLSAEEYSSLSAFWAIVISVGLGLYFPIEQELARESAGQETNGHGLARQAMTLALALSAVVAAGAIVLSLATSGSYLGAGLVIVTCITTLCFAPQFVTRGLLSGAQLSSQYSVLVGLEGFARIVLSVGLVASSFTSALTFSAIVGIAALVSLVPSLLLRDRSWAARAPVPSKVLLVRTLRLIAAALAIQLLLNSAIFIARAMAPESVLAGQLLAFLSLARIPIFIYQVAQVLYMPRLSRSHSLGTIAQTRRLVSLAALGAAVVGIVLTVSLMLWGSQISSLMFGSGLLLEPVGQLTVSLGAALFLCALVLSDSVLALGGHRVVIRTWITSTAIGGLVGVAQSDLILGATLPLIVGSFAAILQFAVSLIISLRKSSS